MTNNQQINMDLIVPGYSQFTQSLDSKDKVELPASTEYLFRECVCKTPGEDDGPSTCWAHHDCRDGSCTHTDGEDE